MKTVHAKDAQHIMGQTKRGDTSVKCSPDGTVLVVYSRDECSFWSLQTGALTSKFVAPADGTIECVAIHPSSKWAAVTRSLHPFIELLNQASGEVHYQIECPGYCRTGLAFSHDGHRILCAAEGELRAFDLLNRRRIDVFSVANGHYHFISLSESDKILLGAPKDGQAEAWDISPGAFHSRRALGKFSVDHSNLTRFATLSGDGTFAVVAKSGNHITRYHVATGEYAGAFHSIDWGNDFGEFRCGDVSRDGNLLAIGDEFGNVLIYDYCAKQIKMRIRDLEGYSSVTFLPDKRRFVTVSGSIRIWELS